MSAAKKGLLQAAYPVWVGSLDASVDEEVLRSAFQHFGTIHSIVVQRDEFGRSKCFGYVNFTSQSHAEKAAKAMNSKGIAGKKVKTKGPRVLQTEGYFVSGGKDYRPLTDCRYFMKRGHCKRKKKKICPYRHNDIARYTTIVCKKWLERECLNVNCIMLHPGGLGVKRSSDSNNDEAQDNDDDGVEVIEYHSDGDNDDDSSSQFSDSSSAIVSTRIIGDSRLSNKEVARMMDLDLDDDDDHTTRSRLRRKASSSSSSNSSISTCSDSSDEEIAPIRSQHSSRSKLSKISSKTKLNEDTVSSDGEEATVKVKHSKTRKTSGGSRAPGKAAQISLEPVGIFWDIENCKVPNGRSAFHLAQKFREHFVEGKREVEFMCVCDTLKETGEVINDLNKAHVTVVHVSAIAKNAADDKLRVSLRRFADTYDSPATVVMVTSDINFSNDLHDLRHRHMFTVILVHNQQVSYALKACAHRTITFEEFIVDIPNREQDAAMRMTYAVTVKGFSPSLSRFKVKDRLLYLTENCGGSVNDVCDIKSGTARVRFRTFEAAVRAQRRLHGANMFGYALTAILEQPQQPQPRPQPMSFKVNDHPLLTPLSQQQHLLQPHPFRQQYPPPLPHPNMPGNYNLSASFPPGSTQAFNNRPPLPAGCKAGPPIVPGGVPAEYYLPKPLQATKLSMSAPPVPPGVRMSQPSLLPLPVHHDQEVIIVGGKGRIVIEGIKAVLDKTLIPIPENKLTGEVVKFCLMASVMIDQDLTIYWDSCMQYIVVVTVDLMKTSQVIQTGPTPSDVMHNQVMGRALLKKCCNILLEKFWLQQLPWLVQPCTWPQQQEEMIKIRSQVIKILKEHDYGWLSWTGLTVKYNDTVKGLPIIPVQLEACCRGAVELQGVNMSTMVAILTEMSPNICVSAEPSVPRRLVRMIKKYSEGVPLLNLVGMYWKEFGPLPMEKTGKKVLNILMLQKGFTYDGNMSDWITVKVRIMDTGKLLGVDAGIISPVPPSSLLNHLYEEFRILLLSTQGQRIQLDQFQPSYQTYYKKSFRVSDYGKDKLVDLLIECPHVRLLSNVVYLQASLETSASSSSLNVMSSSPLIGSTSPAPKVLSSFSSPPDDNTDITELHKSIKQALATSGEGKITLNGLKLRLMVEQKFFMNADYLFQLLSKCDFLKIEEAKDGRTVSWSEKWLAERKKTFAKECKEVLGKEKTTEMSLKKFPEEFCRVYKRQLVCADYGSKKLLNMLEDVSDIEVITTGSQTNLKLKSAASIIPTLSVIKLQLEEYLWSCPEHTSTQVKLKPGFEASTKYKLDYSAYGFAKLTFMLEALSDTIKLTGDGPNRLVSIQPLRKFACEVRKVMESYPSGLCFSNFAPAFRSCLGYECVVGHYGNFSKLSQLFEAIPDTAKVIGEGMAKKVYLIYSKITSNEPHQAGMVTNAGRVAWNILRLLVSSKDHMIPLGDLAGHYNNIFSHQIKLSNYGYNNMEAFLSSLPSIVVKEQDGKKVVTSPLPLLFVRDAIVLMIQCGQHSMKWSDFLANYEMNCNEPFDPNAYGGPSDVKQLLLGCSPWIMVENTSSGLILRLPPFARTDEFTEAVNSSDVKLRSSDEEGNPAMVSAGKDYRRLLSETKRLLLMSPTYSLMLAEIVKHFVANGDPICSSVTELEHVLANTQHNFMFNTADSVLSVDIEARKKKLSKDFVYLFNKLCVWKLSINEVGGRYEECFYTPLEPQLYGCSDIAELMKCKYINQILEISLDGTYVLLSYGGHLNILAARLTELLFVRADRWTYIDCFDVYQQHFGMSLELSELRVESIEELINKPNLRPVVTSDGGLLKLRSQAMLTELLRHLLTIHNGKIQLDQLPQLFTQTFGHLAITEDSKIKEWISGNNILSVASQVVHLNNNQWLVWAPGAYPYPTRTGRDRDMHSHVPLVMAVPTASSSAMVTNDNSHILHGHGSIGNISSTDSTRSSVLSPSHGRKTPGGGSKKNMAIKFPSASMNKPREDIPPLLESSNDEL